MKIGTRVAIFLVLIATSVLLLGGAAQYYTPWKGGLDLSAKIAAVGALIALVYQLTRERGLTEARFVVDLNQSFISNSSISRIYAILEGSKEDRQQQDPFSESDIVELANYLSFFGPFFSLRERGLIDIRTIDIFAYRFLLATNNKFVQQRLLWAEEKPDAWKNIFKLHKVWRRYREENDLPIWQSESDLSTVPGYDEMTYGV